MGRLVEGWGRVMCIFGRGLRELPVILLRGGFQIQHDIWAGVWQKCAAGGGIVGWWMARSRLSTHLDSARLTLNSTQLNSTHLDSPR